MLPNYFVILWDDQPVGLDSNSGGYPFKTDYPGQVKYWRTREEAQHYVDVMQRGSTFNNARIVEIQFRIMRESMWE